MKTRNLKSAAVIYVSLLSNPIKTQINKIYYLLFFLGFVEKYIKTSDVMFPFEKQQ